MEAAKVIVDEAVTVKKHFKLRRCAACTRGEAREALGEPVKLDVHIFTTQYCIIGLRGRTQNMLESDLLHVGIG